MSLPTPPSTSHRDEKENRTLPFTRVSWSDKPEYHPITSSPPRTLSTRASALKAGPSRSILKKIVHPTLPLPDEFLKESTPEPEDPLADLHYLDNPIAQLIALDASLRDSISAYNSLAARLRNCVAGNTDADASWPLFQPIRKHREAFVQAVVRDICQVFVDPLEGFTSETDSPPSTREPPPASSLPSPRQSPKKKKRGMSADQVKRARDLCGVCQAAMKLLHPIFTIPSLYNLFDEEELGYMLTQVLAIPLAKELPTPNARKTCALAIWLIQTQRLPAEVLEPAKDRIAYSLRRGIAGELGKEGKKGSQSDGLKAIHDLVLYQPAIFVPAFAPVIGAILNALLAPTLLIRNQACHALGGLAYAAASLPPSEAHTHMSTAVASRLTKVPDLSPTTPTKKRLDASPTKDSMLVRTLRTTLQATDPKYAAQGPVWAFSVLAYLVVLLGPTVYLHEDLTRIVVAMFTLGMRHTRSSVRGLGCLAWRSMTWAFFRPPHPRITIETDTDGEDDSATEDDVVAERRAHDEGLQSSIKILPAVVDMGAGISTIGAILGQEGMNELQLYTAMRVLRSMSRKGGPACKDAMDLAVHLLGGTSELDKAEEMEWEHLRLLAPGFFSSNPGLLTAEWKMLSSEVKPLLEQCPGLAEVRTLTSEEISSWGMWEQFIDVWRGGLTVLRISWGREAVPSEIREIWFHLLNRHVTPLRENDDQSGLSELAAKARDVLLSLLDDTELDFVLRKEDAEEETDLFEEQNSDKSNVQRAQGLKGLLHHSRWNFAVKLFIARDLFTIARAVFPPDLSAELSQSMLRYMNTHEESLVGDVQCTDEVRSQWACLCAEAALACDPSVMQAFWENSLRKGFRRSDWSPEVRASVWKTFLERWEEADEGKPRSLEAAITLLSATFMESSSWEMTGDDFKAWDGFLRRAIDSALDHGVDATALIDQISGVISTNHSPSSISAVRVADLLLSNVEIADARQVPTELFEFANDTLISSYPPAPRHKVVCMWLLRTLTRVIDGCPQELCFSMLELLVEGMQTWIMDDFQVCTEDEYSSDILPLYQTVLVSLQQLATDAKTLDIVAPLLVAPFCGRKDKHVGTVDAFAEFWQATYAELPEPPRGYSEHILQCLDAVRQSQLEEQEDEAKVEDMTVPQDDESPISGRVTSVTASSTAVELDAEACESEDEGSVVIPSPGTLARTTKNMFKLPVVSRSPSPMATPTVGEMPPSSPLGDAKLRSTASHKAPCPPPSSSPIRSPSTPKRSPKSHASRNKENTSPLIPFPTVGERLAARSPLLLDSILGKRVRDDVEDLAPAEDKIIKKGRLEVSALASSTLTNVQVHMVLHDTVNTLEAASSPSVPVDALKPAKGDTPPVSAGSETDALQTTPTPATRKRKGVFLDAVEVPSVQSVVRTRRRLSLPDVPLTEVAQKEASSSARQPSIRRTRSATRLLGGQADFQKLRYTPKRRRVDRAQQLREEEGGEVSSPLQSLHDAPPFGSDDSIVAASPHVHEHDLPPSDDDPHIGQVTPHRLVSPALRRVNRMTFDSDPPSDDSVLSNSPTTERLSRRTARMNGGRPRIPLLLPVRSRSTAGSSSSALGSDL